MYLSDPGEEPIGQLNKKKQELHGELGLKNPRIADRLKQNTWTRLLAPPFTVNQFLHLNSQTTTDSEPLIAPEQLSQKLKELKSVQFLTTSTSTTTLPEKEREPIKKLRPELSTLLTCYIKQTRSIVKSAHHIEILQTAVLNRDPPRGLRPKINPRIPDNKQIDFIIEWEEVTNTAALNYTKLLLKHWEFTSNTAKENLQQLRSQNNIS